MPRGTQRRARRDHHPVRLDRVVAWRPPQRVLRMAQVHVSTPLLPGVPNPRSPLKVGRRKPSLAGAEADQQHLVDKIQRMRLAETIGQCRVDCSRGADPILISHANRTGAGIRSRMNRRTSNRFEAVHNPVPGHRGLRPTQGLPALRARRALKPRGRLPDCVPHTAWASPPRRAPCVRPMPTASRRLKPMRSRALRIAPESTLLRRVVCVYAPSSSRTESSGACHDRHQERCCDRAA